MHDRLAPHQIHVAVDLLIATVYEGRLRLLLARRPQEPYRGCWALPVRLMTMEESAHTAARELLEEMLPVKNVYMEQLYTFTRANRDPRGRVISIAYLAAVPWPELKECLEQPDARLQPFTVSFEGEKVTLSALEEDQTAFDHWEIITTGIRRLQGKITYTELAFHFLERPQAFSLSEMQMIFEAVLGEKMDKSNFRRSILARYEAAGRIRQTEDIHKKGRSRPAALYRWQP